MASGERRSAWTYVAGAALTIMAVMEIYDILRLAAMLKSQGVRLTLVTYLLSVGLVLLAVAAFLWSNRQVSKGLQLAGGLVHVVYYVWICANNRGGYLGDLVMLYMLLALFWLLVGVGALPRSTPRALVIVVAILGLVAFFLEMQWPVEQSMLERILMPVLRILGGGGLLAAGIAPAGAAAFAGPQPGSIGSADELLRYKELLDRGILTQEEYETKKKELLGL